MPRPRPPRETPIAIGPVTDLSNFDKPTRADIYVTRGDLFRVTFRCCESVEEKDSGNCGVRGVVPQTLEGYQARAQIRRAVGDNFWTDLDVALDEAPGSGRIVISATPEVTRMLYEHGGVWDLELGDGTEDWYKTIVQGKVHLTRDITN
jgi:hypothetical protein